MDSRSIPNVSSIYRELTHLAHSPHTEGDRQSKHMQIMNRLAHSKQDHQRLMNGLYQDHNNLTHSSSNWNSKVESELYGSGLYGSGINFHGSQSVKKTKWRPPNIKYRHIEDQIERDRELHLKNQSKMVRNIPIEVREEQLQRQQNESSLDIKSEISSERELRRPKSSLEQTKQISQFQEQYRETNYKDKIESYYELCRKRMQPTPNEGVTPNNTTSQNTFLRKGTSHKAEDIARAMKLLSDGGN